jgi:hypothetical protein
LNTHSPLFPHSLRIRELDRRLEQDPDARDVRFERAGLLREQACSRTQSATISNCFAARRRISAC